MHRLSHGPAALNLPDGWSGRVLLRDPKGRSFVLQAANFELPAQGQDWMSRPPELPAGQQDRLAQLTGDDVLISLVQEEVVASPAASTAELSDDDFVVGSPRVPVGEALATKSLTVGGQHFILTVNFGRIAPRPSLVDEANIVLGSLRVRE